MGAQAAFVQYEGFQLFHKRFARSFVVVYNLMLLNAEAFRDPCFFHLVAAPDLLHSVLWWMPKQALYIMRFSSRLPSALQVLF